MAVALPIFISGEILRLLLMRTAGCSAPQPGTAIRRRDALLGGQNFSSALPFIH